MNIRITPGPLEGTITPPPSKSIAHRAILAAALAEGVSILRNVCFSQDIAATLRCARGFGCCHGQPGYAIDIAGTGGEKLTPGELVYCDCGESGSTLRFLIPITLALAQGGYFVGKGRLMERPQQPYFDIFDEKGIFYEQKDGALTVRGHLEPGEYRLPGNISSQFVTGLLYALPLLDGDSEIVLTSPLESQGYVDMTLDVLKNFGITAENQNYKRFVVPGDQEYIPQNVTIEADWSQAAFWYGAIALGNQVELEGLNAFSTQGDMCIVPCYLKLQGVGEVELDVSGCPDLVPPLAVMSALRAGETTCLTNAARLRIKESDRLATVTQTLNTLGAQVEEGPDFLKIWGRDGLAGGVTVDCCNDHRIAMMAAVAATRCREPVTLLGAECVSKSYPNFWDDYRMLGGKFDVL
ncbi:3-phosphoshikimate 1-carboxyvinyltransferase [Firmicutes bacterium ASF500]|nr:3-phosphoshikimate 1-carboxyvinyltransferase [Firmicutes bacterium ASF500]